MPLGFHTYEIKFRFASTEEAEATAASYREGTVVKG
jgi:hypothetical protein